MKKKILLITTIIILFGVTGFLVARAVQVGILYVEELVRAEQQDHDYKVRAHIGELHAKIGGLEIYIEKLDERQWNKEDRKEIAEQLRSLEETGLNISRRSMFYYEDTTAHLFFSSNHEIIALFDEVRNTPLYIDRFIRSAERGVDAVYIGNAQRESIQKNFTLLKDEMERISQ